MSISASGTFINDGISKVINRSYNHTAANIAFDSLSINRNPGTYYLGLNSGNIDYFEAHDYIERYSINTLWTEINPDFQVSTENVKNEINLVSYPNPACEHINVNYTLEKPSDLLIEILDFNGRLVQRDEFKAPTVNGTVILNTHDVPNGAYLLNIKTDEGVSTEKIVIQK